MDRIARIQSHLPLESTRQHHRISLPPFTVFQAEDGGSGLAYLSQAVAAISPVTLRDLRNACLTRHIRFLKMIFIDQTAPELAHQLEVLGCPVEQRPLMICSPDSIRPISPVEGIRLTSIDSSASDAELRMFIEANARGFNLLSPAAGPDALDSLRSELETGRGILALAGRQATGVGLASLVSDGLAQLSSIATLPAYRRRGIGAWITHELACAAFEMGADTAYLVAQDDATANVYSRAGFEQAANYCTCRFDISTEQSV